MELRILHCADLHLDSPFIGLSSALDLPPTLLRTLRQSTFDAFTSLVDAALDQRVDAFTVAGDVFDAADHGLRPHAFFLSELARLSRAGIRSFVVAGNHDPLNGRRHGSGLPQGVHLFGATPEKVALERNGHRLATVYGVSFPVAAVSTNLAAAVMKLHERTPEFHVAVVHANVGGVSNHDDYAPCSLDQLTGSPFDAWLLGHVHEARVLHPGLPLVLYPGNIQGRSIRESGPRGAYLVTLHEGLPAECTFVPTRGVRFDVGQTDVSRAEDAAAVVAEVVAEWETRCAQPWNDVPLVVVRWRLTGQTGAQGLLGRHGLEEVQHALEQQGLSMHPPVVLERLVDDTRPAVDMETLMAQPGFMGALAAVTMSAQVQGMAAQTLRNKLRELFTQGPAARHLEAVGQSLDDPQAWERLLARAAQRAIETLTDSKAG